MPISDMTCFGRRIACDSPVAFLCARKMLTKIIMCNNKIITHDNLLFEKRTKMDNVAIIMPVIGAVGFIIIVATILIIRSMEKREKSRALMRHSLTVLQRK